MLIFLTLIDSDEGKERFIKIYEQYKNLMFHVALQLLNNTQDAEDAVQDAFFKIAENIDKISEPLCTKTRNFVVIITERKAIDIIRKRKPLNPEQLDEELAGCEIDYDGRDLLVECILKLPARYREIILLKYYFGYDLREISQMLGIRLNTVRQTEQRAKAKLRRICEEEGYDI